MHCKSDTIIEFTINHHITERVRGDRGSEAMDRASDSTKSHDILLLLLVRRSFIKATVGLPV